eukprot:8243061-Heterocapsa_arctica.AAC.1
MARLPRSVEGILSPRRPSTHSSTAARCRRSSRSSRHPRRCLTIVATHLAAYKLQCRRSPHRSSARQ